MQNYIDSFKKERASYPEHNTLYFENIEKITVESDIITPPKKRRKEDFQEYRQIPFGENE